MYSTAVIKRAPVETKCWEMAQQVRAVTRQSVEVAFADQSDTGDQPRQAASEYGIQLLVVKLPDAKRGFVLLPRRWVVERSFDCTARFRRLARDYERMPDALMGLHFLAFAVLMLSQFIQFMAFVL
jgi:transposase